MLSWQSQITERVCMEKWNDVGSLRVGTFFTLIADIARSRHKHPRLNSNVALHRLRDVADEVLQTYPNDAEDVEDPAKKRQLRDSLLRLAAEAVRAADEEFPGDGVLDEDDIFSQILQ